MNNNSKIILRPFQSEDAVFVNSLHNDDSIKFSSMMHPFQVPLELDKIWIENIIHNTKNKEVYFALTEGTSGNICGFTSLTKINWINRNCYFSIVIGKKYQGKGLGKEATQKTIDFAFRKLNLHKVLLEVVSNNSSAIGLYEKIGFIKEGHLIEQYYSGNKFFDVDIYAVYNKL